MKITGTFYKAAGERVGLRDQVDAYGRSNLLDVKSLLQDMTGELLIDDPGNKSGRKKFPSYPILKST